MRILTKSGYIDAVALFFELTDEQLETVKGNKDYYQDKSLLTKLTDSKGDNAHICGLCSNENKDIIYKHLKLLLKDYKTVSWWDKEMDSFKLTRR